MHWNHRVIVEHRIKNGIGKTSYGIHEVHYNNKHRIKSWTTEPIEIAGSIEELRDTLMEMLLALDKPTLIVKRGTLVEGGDPTMSTIQRLEQNDKY